MGIIEENSDVLQSDHSNKWLGFEKILDEYKALKTPSTEKRFQIMEKLSKKCWFTKNASKKKKGTEAAQRAFVQFKRSAKNVSLRVAGKAKIGAKKWRHKATRAALAAGEGNDEKIMEPNASGRAAGKRPGSLKNLTSSLSSRTAALALDDKTSNRSRSDTTVSQREKGARASDFSDLKVPAGLSGETIVRDHFKADAGLSQDGSGASAGEKADTTRKFTFPLKGKFERLSSWGFWNPRYYRIQDNGNLEYFKTEAHRDDPNKQAGRNDTFDFASSKQTIERVKATFRDVAAVKIVDGRRNETIKIRGTEFFTHLLAVYTELKNEAKLEQLHNISNTLRASTNVSGRRRMAQREFSSRRDSPVMTRLLQEIIAAQDN